MKFIQKSLLWAVLFGAFTSIAFGFPVSEAAKHVGESGIVTGTVSQVYVSKSGNVFLNFDGSYPNQVFSATIFKDHVSQFPGGAKDLQAMEGKEVTITGKIKEYKGKPEIIVSEPSQIQVK